MLIDPPPRPLTSEEWFRFGFALGLRAGAHAPRDAEMIAERIEKSLPPVPSGEAEWQSWMAELEVRSWAAP